MSLCYVTAFLDIGRGDWNRFTRSFDEYLECFKLLIAPFERDHPGIEMVAYIDSRHFESVKKAVPEGWGIKLISIDEEWLAENIHVWKGLAREKEIMESQTYKDLISHRLPFPQNVSPKYTLINHAKIDFVNWTIDSGLSKAEFFGWADFGYCKIPSYTPDRLLDVSKLDANRINYTLVNLPTERDRDSIFMLQYAPERIAGCFFAGKIQKMREYQELYHKVWKDLQDKGIANEDQSMALACAFLKPDLFCLHNLGGWHRGLIAFQVDEPKAQE